MAIPIFASDSAGITLVVRRNTMPTKSKSNTKLFHLKGFDVSLVRLTDLQYYKLGRRSIAIFDDGYFMMKLARSARRDGGGLDFPRVYFILKLVYGRSGYAYDDWKGSFAFPFAIDVIKGDHVFPYLLKIHNHRSILEFSIRKVVGDKSQADGIYHHPFTEEFSREEINYFLAFFYGYLEGRLEVALENGARMTKFIHKVDSNLILYGCRQGQFFEEQYDDEDEFEAVYRRYTVTSSKG
jgi:hypothetical protein